MKTKFLWIEDNARTDLKRLLAPVYMDGGYNPYVAPNVTEGVYRMMEAEFDAVVVDIRLPPGSDSAWESLYDRLGREKGAARLGLHLLYSLFAPRPGDVRLGSVPTWVEPRRFGVLTVEEPRGELGDALSLLDIRVYRQKTAYTPNETLLKMIQQITAGAR